MTTNANGSLLSRLKAAELQVARVVCNGQPLLRQDVTNVNFLRAETGCRYDWATQKFASISAEEREECRELYNREMGQH